MDGRAFLEVARETVKGPREAHWRNAATRAYYATVWEAFVALDRWGASVSSKGLHRDVRVKLDRPGLPDLRKVAESLEELGGLRNRADYELLVPYPQSRARRALELAEEAIQRLDEIEADSVRRQAAREALAQVKSP